MGDSGVRPFEWLSDHLTAVTTIGGVGILTLLKLSREWQAEELAKWLHELQRAEAEYRSSSWDDDVKRFHASDTPQLMDRYYRGVPHQIAKHISLADLSQNDTHWLIPMVVDASSAGKQLALTLGNSPDTMKRHRAQVFSAIPATQCLSIADVETHKFLCNHIANLLRDTQRGAAGYTESACDQINQIIPQVLTDQLIAGPHAWHSFRITDELLSALMAPANGLDSAIQFSTGISFTTQFLAYYRRSLADRKVHASGSIGHYGKIENFFNDLARRTEPLYSRNLGPYGEYFRKYAERATSRGNIPLHRVLIRQTSAAIMADPHPSSNGMSNELRGLCLLNSFRAAHSASRLGDAGRIDAIQKLLVSLSVSRSVAHQAVKDWLDESDPQTSKYAHEFAEGLPADFELRPTGAVFSKARRTTLDEIVARIRGLHRKPGKLENAVARVPSGTSKAICEIIFPVVREVAKCVNAKQRRRIKDIPAMVDDALNNYEQGHGGDNRRDFL